MRAKRFCILIMAFMAMLLIACGDEPVIVEEVVMEETTATKEDETAVVTPEVTPEVTATPNVTEAVVEDEETSETEVTEAVKEDEINRDDIEALSEAITLYAQKKVNIRKGPDTSYDVVGSLKVNDGVEVVGKCKSVPWVEIKFKDATAFVHKDFLAETERDLVAEAEAQAKAAEEAAANQVAQAPQPAPQQPAAPAAAVDPNSVAGVLFIGDSRACQMQAYTGGAGCSWICEYGQKYDWFESTAVPKADKIIGQGTKVVICMGVNDPGRCNDYANLVNRKAGEWNARGAKVYYVSVNPVAAPYEDKAPSIDNFNATMPGLLSGVRWIDTASVIKQGGYVLEDGIHYDANGNVSIFGLIYGCLK